MQPSAVHPSKIARSLDYTSRPPEPGGTRKTDRIAPPPDGTEPTSSIPSTAIMLTAPDGLLVAIQLLRGQHVS
jgi:hypothetical protein